MKIMEDICMGLMFLNQEGIVHRDLKECNIRIDRKKRGRIIDFGSVSSTSKSNKYKPVDDKGIYCDIKSVQLKDILFLINKPS